MKKHIALMSMLVIFGANSVFSAVPTCHTSNGGYCKYTGKVARIYVNTDNLILLYFDTPVPLNVPESIGFSVASGGAAAFKIDENPDVAKLFYSTALAAQASGRNVNIQMRETLSGYLKFDRIWLLSPE